jgi:hypothetical protein
MLKSILEMAFCMMLYVNALVEEESLMFDKFTVYSSLKRRCSRNASNTVQRGSVDG